MSKKYPPVIQHAPEIAHRDGGWQCYYCGAALRPYGADAPTGYRKIVGGYFYNEFYQFYAVDHVVAKTSGGAHDLSNLVLTCTACNCRKGKRNYETFIEEIDRWLETYVDDIPSLPIYRQP